MCCQEDRSAAVFSVPLLNGRVGYSCAKMPEFVFHVHQGALCDVTKIP